MDDHFIQGLQRAAQVMRTDPASAGDRLDRARKDRRRWTTRFLRRGKRSYLSGFIAGLEWELAQVPEDGGPPGEPHAESPARHDADSFTAASPTRMPIGAWVHLDLPGKPPIVAFTYVDPTAGLSAGGGTLVDRRLDTSLRVTVRLPMAKVSWHRLTGEEIAELGLEPYPSWVTEAYGPQPEAGTLWSWWQEYPKLQGRFHAELPDMLRVLVHDGGPRLTDRSPELIWVRVTGGTEEVLEGRLSNCPNQLESVGEGSPILFVVPDGGEHPLRVTEKYLQERSSWVIAPCNGCGLTELFDAPSDLLRVVFPDLPPGASAETFTAFCGACGGFQLVQRRP